MNFSQFSIYFLLVLGSSLLQAQTDCEQTPNKKAKKLYHTATKAYAENRIGEAIKALDNSLELDPDYADAQYLMGYLNFKKPLGRGFAQAQKAWLSYLDLVALDCPKRKHYVFFYLGDMFYKTDQCKYA
ncbi:MAG: tetratricopeptide repeat protein, partial [Bacteroidales bacterium]